MVLRQDGKLTEHTQRPGPGQSGRTGEVARLHIQQLVLEGIPPLDEARVLAAVQQELARLFLECGVPRRIHDDGAASRKSCEPNVAGESDPRNIGAAIARAVYRELAR